VRNRAIDVLRRDSGRAPAVSLDLDTVPEQESQWEPTEAEALRHEAAREVRGVLSDLPEDQLQVVQLAYFGGLTHSEIAEVLGMTLGTVKGRMRLAMEKLRAQLAEGI